MAGIGNINNIYNIKSKKIQSKLSFSIGDKFAAHIIDTKQNGEVIIKSIEGWQFIAQLDKPIDFIPKGLLNFEVQDFSEGKLNIKLLVPHENSSEENVTLKSLLQQFNLKESDEELKLLQKMIKFNIPLNKKNISEIKTLVDLKKSILENDDKIGQFIERYIETKNDINVNEKQYIQTKLKGFFNQLNNLEIDDLLTLIENEVDITEDNIISYKNLFKKDGTIFENISGFVLNNKDLADDLLLLEKKLSSFIDINATSQDKVKEEITNKSEYLKGLLREILDNKNSIKPEIYDRIIDSIESKINDFKVFNTVSNNYYYYDLPLNIDEREYDFKFLIKDERKKGKKIDSKNVKIAASVKTKNLGVVDSYISINNDNMNIDIKSSEKWVEILKGKHHELTDKLNKLGFNININFSKKIEDMDIVTSREFFNEDSLGAIDTRV